MFRIENSASLRLAEKVFKDKNFVTGLKIHSTFPLLSGEPCGESQPIQISAPQEPAVSMLDTKFLLPANVPEKKEKVKLHSSMFDDLAEAISHREKQLSAQSTMTLEERMKADYFLSRAYFLS